MIKRSIYFSIFFLAGAFTLHAQNNTSAYSIIGIGDIEKSSFDRSSGMGHAGVALSSNRFLNQANPAAFGRLDEHFFYAEVSGRYKGTSYSGTPVTDPTQSQSSDAQFKKIAIALKLRPRWAISVGILPYSTSNYSFSGMKTVQGTNFSTPAFYEGSGSTNQFYLTNSYSITKNLFIGVQASYLFGQLQETETLTPGLTDSALVTTRNIYLGNIMFKGGLQYRAKINKDWAVSVGATVANKTKLRADYGLHVTDGNTVVVNNEFYRSNYFSVPTSYTGGVAVTYKDAYTLTADYNYQGWSDMNYKGINYSLVNSQRYSVGAEYSKKFNYMNQSFERYFFQAGFFYSDSYLRIAGHQLQDYGLTLGAGGMIARTNQGDFGLQGALELGQRGTTASGLIKENYSQVSITLCYRDFWVSRKLKRFD